MWKERSARLQPQCSTWARLCDAAVVPLTACIGYRLSCSWLPVPVHRCRGETDVQPLPPTGIPFPTRNHGPMKNAGVTIVVRRHPHTNHKQRSHWHAKWLRTRCAAKLSKKTDGNDDKTQNRLRVLDARTKHVCNSFCARGDDEKTHTQAQRPLTSFTTGSCYGSISRQKLHSTCTRWRRDPFARFKWQDRGSTTK